MPCGSTILRGHFLLWGARRARIFRAPGAQLPTGIGYDCGYARDHRHDAHFYLLLLPPNGKHDLKGFKRTPGRQNDLVGFKLHWRLAAAQQATLGPAVELFLFPGGYAGLELVEGGIANLCLVVRREHFTSLGGRWDFLLSGLRGETSATSRTARGRRALLATATCDFLNSLWLSPAFRRWSLALGRPSRRDSIVCRGGYLDCVAFGAARCSILYRSLLASRIRIAACQRHWPAGSVRNSSLTHARASIRANGSYGFGASDTPCHGQYRATHPYRKTPTDRRHVQERILRCGARNPVFKLVVTRKGNQWPQ